MIDTHAHLDALDDPADALARARAVGVTRVVAIASGRESARATRAIARDAEGVFVAAGIHPHQSSEEDDAHAVVSADDVAVGEIGLDFFRDYAPRDTQRRVFLEQLALATELRKPVIVHTRAAEHETAELLATFSGDVVLHCFSSPSLLPVALERGYYVSFAGNVTYPRAVELREAAAQVPAARLLAETDTPYLAPQAVRGRQNQPAYVVHTLVALAELRGETTDGLAAQIDANATAVFSLS